MSHKRNFGIIAGVYLLAWTLAVFSVHGVAAPQDDYAERVVQRISEADVKREALQNNEENAKRAAQIANEAGTESLAQDGNETVPPMPDLRLAVKRNAKGLRADSSDLQVSIPDAENGTVHLKRADGKKSGKRLIVSLPETGNTFTAKVTSDGSVVYSNYEQETDVAVQAFNDSARIVTVLNGTGSPSEYAYRVTLPAGGRIERSESGSLLVFDGQGGVIGGFGAPWAVDGAGVKIPTHYEIRGEVVVQVIEHLGRNTSYPVVADPWLWIDLINSASWKYNSPYGWTLMVKPTGWARSLGTKVYSYSVGVAGWNELYSKYKNRGLNTNLGGMKDQYICHQQFAFLKSTWNLDEWRPDVSYAKTVAAACNP